MRASGVIVGAAASATFRKAAKKLDRLLAVM
jgi:hypothetical protein